MGIKNFYKFINKYAKESISEKNISNYKNKIVGIDANHMIHKIIYAVRARGYDIKNDDIIVTHIHMLLMKIYGLQKYNIIPIFVFDGKPPNLKLDELKKRQDLKNKLIKKHKYGKTEDSKRKYFYMKSYISDKEYQDCINLITILGYKIVMAPEEADAQLAYMCKKKYIDYIISDDMDILIFGGEILLKNFSTNDKKKFQEINLNILLNKLSITQNDLIKIAILLGSDYCNNKSLSITKVHSMINNLPLLCKQSYTYFKNPIVNKSHTNTKKQNSNIDELIIFLKSFNYNEQDIDKIISKLK